MKIKKNFNVNLIYIGVFLIPFEYLIGYKYFSYILIIISCFTILTNIKRKSIIPFTKFTIGYLFLIFFAAISTLYSKDIISTSTILKKIIPYYIFCFTLSFSILNENKKIYENLVKCLKIFLFSTLIISVIVSIIDLNNLTEYTRIGKRAFGEFHTMFSYYLIISFCISIWLYFSENKKSNRIIFGVIGIFIYIICVLTAIRKAIFIPIVFYVIYSFISSNNKKRVVKNFIKIIILMTFLLFLYKILMKNDYFSLTVGKRIGNFVSGINGIDIDENSFNIRMLLKNEAIQCFRKYPILGYGFGAFRGYAYNTIGVKLYAHNNFLELLASTGIIGFSIYYGIIINVLKLVNKRLKITQNTIYVFGLSFLLTLLVMDFSIVSYLAISIMFTLSIIACACKCKFSGENN